MPQEKKSTVKKVVKKKSSNPADSYPARKDKRGNPTIGGGEGTNPPFTPIERKNMPKVGNTGTAKNGKSFPDLNKDGKITKADILKGRGVIAKKGATVKKAFLGKMLGGAGGKSGGIGGILGGLMGKNGKSVKKAEDGYTPKQNRLARREKRVYDKYTEARSAGNTKRSGRLYDKLMDKQTKSIKAGVNVQYKTGGSMKKCKYGCK